MVKDRAWETDNPKFRSAPYWDRVVGDFEAVIDLPFTIFAANLVHAYPDAHVFYTDRPAQEALSWVAGFHRWLTNKYLRETIKSTNVDALPTLDPLLDLFNITFDADPNNAPLRDKRNWKHYLAVEAAVKQSQGHGSKVPHFDLEALRNLPGRNSETPYLERLLRQITNGTTVGDLGDCLGLPYAGKRSKDYFVRSQSGTEYFYDIDIKTILQASMPQSPEKESPYALR